MEAMDSLVATIALTLGVGWASGINLYAAILTLGLLHNLGYATLPPELAVVAEPLILAAAGFMYCVEFFADKAPGVDTGWDTLHTFIRLPAGAVLAAAAVGDVAVPAQIAAGLVGGTMAATSHALKTGGRAVINVSPEPFTNWTASLLEDVAVIGGMWVALQYPWAFLLLLALFVALTIWLLPKIWRALRGLFEAVGRWIGRGRYRPPPPPSGSGNPRTDHPVLPAPPRQ